MNREVTMELLEKVRKKNLYRIVQTALLRTQLWARA